MTEPTRVDPTSWAIEVPKENIDAVFGRYVEDDPATETLSIDVDGMVFRIALLERCLHMINHLAVISEEEAI